ncbi:MAG: RNA methyltransferase [Moheibacter sp.]
MQIESPQNPKIKNLLKLREKSRERKKQGLFVVEGIQENELALAAAFEPVEFFICVPIFDGSLNLSEFQKVTVSPNVYEKIAYRGTTAGLIGVYKSKTNNLEEIRLSKNALVVVLESVEKPGNLGAILRSCDGAGADAIIVCDPLTDFYNSNVIRSSVGTVFTNQLGSDSFENVVHWLKKNKLKIVSTYLNESTQNLYEIDFHPKTALIFGTEHSGLTNEWLEHSDQTIKIPMNGKVDSLNVSNAVAICIYEAVRQKNYSKS